ncbi:MAG TPA: tetratricopeptide repeat protein, partial [Pantanalinema sp.]
APAAFAAIASPGPTDWPRLEALIRHQAFEVARQTLQGDLAALHGEDREHGRFLLGYAERRLGNPRAAREHFGAIPPHSLWHPRAQKELVLLERAEGRHDAADATLARLLPQLTGPEKDDAGLELADDRFARGAFEPALAAYQAVFDESKDPQRREHAAYAIGWCYERLANPARAIWSWKEAARLFPESLQAKPARLMLANQYLRLGKPLLAADELRALATSTQDLELAARAQFVAGEGYAAVGNWKLAGAAYAMVKPGTRWSEPAEYGEAYARWQSGDAKGAKPAMERWLSKYPKSASRPAVLYALGRVHLELANPAQARASFEKAVAEPGSGSYEELSLFGLAELDYNDGRFPACIERARRLLSGYPESAQRGPTRWLLAESLLSLKRYDEAIAIYTDLAKREGDLAFLEGKGDAVTFRLGLAHFRTEEYAAAASYLKDVTDGRYGQEALYWLAEATYRTGDYAGALAHYARFLKAYPGAEKAPEAAYGQAYSAYQLKRYDEARRLFKQAGDTLKAAPLRQDAMLRLGSLQLSAHDWGAAESTYASLYGSQLSVEALPDVLLGLAWATYRKGNAAEALKLADSFSERFGGHSKLNRVRAIAGQAAFRLGKYPEAVSRFEAILKDPKAGAEERADAQARIGAAYFNAAQYDQAADTYQAIYADGNRPKAEREQIAQPLVQARIAKGDWDEARRVALEATGSAWAGDALGRIAQGYLDKGRAEEAIGALDAIESPTLEQRHLLAMAYFAASNTEAGLATLDALCRVSGPQQIAWTLELADRYLAANEPARAREAYALLAKLQPGHPAVLKGAVAVATAYAKDGRDQLALDAYRELAKRFSSRLDVASVAYLRIGQIELKRGNHADAAVAYRQAEKASPAGSLGAVQARYWLGYALVAGKRFEDAAAELSKLKVPSTVGREWQALAWLKQGEAYEHLRRWKDAEKLYRQVAGTTSLPAAERKEASDRLKWIDQNVNRR